MKLGVYLLKPAVFTQKRRTTLVKHGSRLAVRTTGQLCKSVPLLFARSPFGAGAGGVEIHQYPVCCPLPSAALFTALPLGVYFYVERLKTITARLWRKCQPPACVSIALAHRYAVRLLVEWSCSRYSSLGTNIVYYIVPNISMSKSNKYCTRYM